MRGRAPYASLQLALPGHRRAVPIQHLQLELLVFAERRDDFDDLVQAWGTFRIRTLRTTRVCTALIGWNPRPRRLSPRI
jgi:hypothetical protein